MQPAQDRAGEHRPRSGSEQRQKQHIVSVRMSADERAELEAAAGDMGLTLGSYIRDRALMKPQTARRRRASVDVQAVGKLQAELNRIGGNIHQLLRRVNFGDASPSHEEVVSAFKGYREAIAAILETLGRR